MGRSILSHNHLHLVGRKANGQRRMALINLQKAFDIINHKILLRKMYSVGFSATQLLGFLVSWFESYLCLPVFNWVSEINTSMLQVPTAE